MKIEFDEETFLEDDDVWSTLFVKINGGDWHMAQPLYGTEDKAEVINILHKQRDEQLFKKILNFVLILTSISILISFISIWRILF